MTRDRAPTPPGLPVNDAQPVVTFSLVTLSVPGRPVPLQIKVSAPVNGDNVPVILTVRRATTGRIHDCRNSASYLAKTAAPGPERRQLRCSSHHLPPSRVKRPSPTPEPI